ncbi:tryptophan 2,3-dioxygenase-like, partial [Saccostrea cucullata]|uniref:tryptophan 2,3-dioxygenase-like n=1 Tax=Saccostrea cuccullata TaxID=36930 RepID=UPI002ED4D71E
MTSCLLIIVQYKVTSVPPTDLQNQVTSSFPTGVQYKVYMCTYKELQSWNFEPVGFPYVADMSDRELTYDSYLGLDKLLQCQELESEKAGNKVDEEHLFIIVHQAFELWFKQILVDLHSVVDKIQALDVSKRDFAEIPTKLGRIILIQKLIIGHFEIIETMPPAIFLNFRKYLRSGSGFQSLQFRLIENTLGLRREVRKSHKEGKSYTDEYNEKQREEAEKSEKGPSLFTVLEVI